MTIEANYEVLILVARNEAAEDIINDLAGVEHEEVMDRYREINKGTQSILHSTYHRLFSLIHISNFRVTFRFVVSLTVDVCFVVNDQRGHNYVWFSYR